MKVKILSIKGDWREIADAARTTVNMDQGTGEPASSWKKKMLLAEHSPVRKLVICWKWEEIPTFVSDHIARHKIGIEHFISTQRTDRTGVNRCEKSQCEPRNHECEANAQAIIAISRKRLCKKHTDPETLKAWSMFLLQLKELQPELYSVCVPECVYRGFCPELEACTYVYLPAFSTVLESYRRKV